MLRGFKVSVASGAYLACCTTSPLPWARYDFGTTLCAVLGGAFVGT